MLQGPGGLREVTFRLILGLKAKGNYYPGLPGLLMRMSVKATIIDEELFEGSQNNNKVDGARVLRALWYLTTDA